MPQLNDFLATLLQTSGSAFAGLAALRTLGVRPEAGTGLGADPAGAWKEWLEERIEELAAALSAARPELFAQQGRWAAQLFSARQVPVANLKCALESLRSVLMQELPPATQDLADEYLSHALSAIDSTGMANEKPLSADTEEGKLAASYLLALLEGNLPKASSLVHTAASEGWSIPDLYARVLAPAQREVGRMWLHNEINVAEEHLATTATKMIMSQLRSRAEAQPSHGKTAVAGAVPQDQHDVGLQMVSDLFEIHGWRVIPLGANVPIPDLVQAMEMYEGDLLLLSAALTKHLPAVRDTIAAFRRHAATREVKIVVGGTAFTGVADLAEQYGADAYAADAAEALRVGNRLVGLSD